MSVVNTNVKSLTAQASLQRVGRDLDTAMERLSTGKRINSAADDAAGLSISERMTSQVRSLNMAIRNANDGISLVQTAEGAMVEVGDMLQRMRELAVQAVNGTYNADDRASLDAEVQQLKAEIDRIATTTKFNNQAILDGSFKNKVVQIGDSAEQSVGIAISSLKAADLGMGGANGAGADTLVSQRLSLADVDAGDIVINGQGLGAIDQSGGDDIEDVVKNINDNVDNVSASAFNAVVAKNAGNGVTTNGQFKIKVTALGAGTATTYAISASSSLQELRDNINAEAGGVVTASINDDGKLMLTNTTGATISIADGTDTSGYDTGSGFYGGATASAFVDYAGFLKLESIDGTPVTIERGNTALSSPGTLTDLASLGFREVTREGLGNDAYTLTGLALTSAGTEASWGQTDIKINGVQIYDVDIATDSFAGKLAAINNFSGETGVNASAYYEQSFAIDTDNFTVGGKAYINGVELVWTDVTVASAVSVINAKTQEHGLVATANGSNIVLSGSNVQSVDIRYENLAQTEYSAIHDAVSAAHSAATASTARTIDFTDGAFIAEGRTITLAGGSSWSVSYTVQNGDTAGTVAEELRTKIVAAIDTTLAISEITFASAGTITFSANVNYGKVSFTITLDDGTVFGAADVTYGAIRLDSANETPIAVELGDASDVNEHGLLEMNVGAADFQVNAATFGAGGGSSLSGVNVMNLTSAQKAIGAIDAALTTVNSQRSTLGALQNRLEHTVDNLTNVVVNTEASRSRILDTDYATETAELAKAQIIQQAATAMLAQANQQPQTVLALLQ